MTLNELSKKLSEMYENADEGEKGAMILLFGIRYAKIIKDNGFNANEILKNTKLKNGTKMKDSYNREIYKGIKLSNFVIEKEK
jgi:hypothetical protein